MDRDQRLSDYLFFCEFERRYSAHTVEAYRRDLGFFFEFTETKPLSSAFEVAELKRYLSHMLSDRSLSVATARRRIASIRGFCGFLAQTYGFKDPFQTWQPALKRPKRLPRALSRESVAKLVQLPNDASKIEKDTIFLVLLLGATGLRVSELCSIKLSDVTEDGGSIHIHGKGAKDRIVYVGNCGLSAKLKEILADRRQFDAMNAPLFLNKRGKKLAPQTVRRRLHKIVQSRGFDTAITPHSMRHTAATLLLEQGTDIRFVQRQLGHSSISTTELYTHVTDIALKRAITSANPMADFIS